MTNQPLIFDWLKKASNRNKTDIAVKWKSESGWVSKNWFEYLQCAVYVGHFLQKKGLKKTDKVALISATRWEWAILDVGVIANQQVLVPLYVNLTNDDFAYILNHSEAKIVFVENQSLKKQIGQIKSQLKLDPEIVVIEEFNFAVEDINQAKVDEWIEKTKLIPANAEVTLIYTSGTTGAPKGVVMSQAALVSEINEAFGLFNISEKDSSLSFLPYAHVMGRVEHWGSLHRGYTLQFAKSIDSLKTDLKETAPTMLVAVPRVFEKIYAGILNQIETQGTKKKIFHWALDISTQANYFRETNQSLPLSLVLKYELAQKLVFSKIRQAFGGQLRFAICGGAPLSAELGHFFLNLGIKILEGYGLTETFAAITVNTESHFRFGTVGKPIGDVDIRFDSDGEILVKSEKVMIGYYKNSEATESAFVDGYFRTGDIGEFTSDGFLKITDRKKDLIKTSGGKYVAPQKLEGLLKSEPLIAQALVIGDKRKFISCLISMDPSLGEDSPQNREKIKAHILKVNSQLASFESIKKFEIVFHSWTVDAGDLTPSMKLKRKVIEKKYASLIDEMYD